MKLATPCRGLAKMSGKRLTVDKPAPAGLYTSTEWRQLLQRVKAERGDRCEDCGRPGYETRIYGDHVVELKDGGAPLDETNVRLRCGRCHSNKTIKARAQRHGLA